MANFSRSDLKYSYSWNTTEGDSKKVTGFPDSVLLNRSEGYEVLYFINRYMTGKNYSLLATFHKVEEAIKTKLPGDKRSHANVKKWLDDNYKF